MLRVLLISLFALALVGLFANHPKLRTAGNNLKSMIQYSQTS